MSSKTVIITGAARGIGAALALGFAMEGYDLVLNYRSNPPEMAPLEALGVKTLLVQGDVGDFTQAEALIKAAKEAFGRIDVLINNAGITRDGLMLRMKEEDFDAVVDTNLKGTFNTIRHASGVMLKQRSGAIINMTSVVGLSGNQGQVNYAASKAGVVGLTKSVAKELGGRGITCNAIAPGFIRTDMTKDLPDNVKQSMLEAIPLKRFGDPESVTAAALFLAKSDYITGQVLSVDGGMYM